MTIKELSQLFWLNKEIEQEKKRLSELEEAATDTAAKISGLPHVGGISDKTALAAEIADSRNIIDAKLKQSVAEYNRLNRYIAAIDDSMVRQIMQLRFVNGLEWGDVADELYSDGLENFTEYSVKQKFYRFLKEN